jgi:hypothetical protein
LYHTPIKPDLLGFHILSIGGEIVTYIKSGLILILFA